MANDPAPVHPKAKEIIERVRQALREVHKTTSQSELADKCQMDQGTLSRILRKPSEEKDKKKHERWKDPKKVSLNSLLWAWQGSGNKIEDFIPFKELPRPLSVLKIQREDKASLLDMFIKILSERTFEEELEKYAFEVIEEGIRKMYERKGKKVKNMA